MSASRHPSVLLALTLTACGKGSPSAANAEPTAPEQAKVEREASEPAYESGQGDPGKSRADLRAKTR